MLLLPTIIMVQMSNQAKLLNELWLKKMVLIDNSSIASIHLYQIVNTPWIFPLVMKQPDIIPGNQNACVI